MTTQQPFPRKFGGGKYEEIGLLGQGGFAQVHLVRDNLGRQWALKQIRPEIIAKDPKMRERFEREAQIQAHLKHAHIAAVHSFDSQEGFLVIEYIEGKTLREYLDDNYPDGMDPTLALEILQPIGEALSYIHKSAGFAHLDVTPKNILIQETHGLLGKADQRIVLADFGLARVLDSNGMANPTMIAGTPGYWSPEQRGLTNYKPGERSDVYALGIMAGEMLTGLKPDQVLKYLRGSEDTILSPRVVGVFQKVKEVLKKATVENPEERYASIKGFVNSLTRTLEEETVVDVRPIEPLKPPKWRKVSLVMGACLILLVVLLLLGEWFRYVPFAGANSASPPVAPPRTLCLAADLPLNGTEMTSGLDIEHGIQLALYQNHLDPNQPGATPYHDNLLKLNPMDDSSEKQQGLPDPTQGAANIQGLLQDTQSCPNPIAVIGSTDSSLAIAEIPVAAQQSLLLMSTSATAPCLTLQNYSDPSSSCIYDVLHPQGVPNTFARLPGTDVVQGYRDADFMVMPQSSTQSGLGAQRIEVVMDGEVYGIQLAESVMEELSHRGITPVGIDCAEFSENASCSVDPSSPAFSTDNIQSLATKIQKDNPDAIFFGGRNDTGASLLRKQLGVLGLDRIPFVGGDALVDDKDQFFGTIGSHAANTYASFPAADPSTFTSGAAAVFASQYNDMFGEPPGPYSANGYDAASIIIKVIKTIIDTGGQVTSGKVVQGVLNHSFISVTGNQISFDPHGDNNGRSVFTFYQSQQQSPGIWGWKVLTTIP